MSLSLEDRLNIRITLEEVKEGLKKIKAKYLYIYKNYLSYFVDPNAIYCKIVNTIKNISNEFEDDNKNYEEKYLEYLPNEINYFSEKIQKDNDIFNGIIDHNKDLLTCLDNLRKIIEDKSKIRDITPPIDLWNNINEKKYDSFCSNEMSISKNSLGSDNYRILLKCNCCSLRPFYFCNKHCYNYFCDCCKIKFDSYSDICSHNFEQIDEDKEREKIEFVNSSIYLIKNICQITDKIFKLSDKSIHYPFLNKDNDLFSQKEFLAEINNLNNNYNLNQNKGGLCDLIKESLIRALKINKTPSENNDDNFLYSEDDSYLNDKYGKNEYLLKFPKSISNDIKSIVLSKPQRYKDNYIDNFQYEYVCSGFWFKHNIMKNHPMIKGLLFVYNDLIAITKIKDIYKPLLKEVIIYKTLYKKVIITLPNDPEEPMKIKIINFTTLELERLMNEKFLNIFYFSKENRKGFNVIFTNGNLEFELDEEQSFILAELFLNLNKLLNFTPIIKTKDGIKLKNYAHGKILNKNSNNSSRITKVDIKRYKKREKYKYIFNNKKFLRRIHGKKYFVNNKKGFYYKFQR